MTIRTLLVHDGSVAEISVRSLLAEDPEFEIIGECGRGEQAVAEAHRLRPDLLFLDVNMEEDYDLQLAPLLRAASPPAIVFLTGNREYAVEAFELGAIDYLLKPLDEIRFQTSLSRIKRFLGSRLNSVQETNSSILEPLDEPFLDRVAVTDRKHTRFVRLRDVEWIAAAGDYTHIHSRGASHLVREPLSAFSQKLAPGEFCRIHRSAVVNLTMVSELVALRNQDMLVRLRSGKILRSSRTFSQNLRLALNGRLDSDHKSQRA